MADVVGTTCTIGNLSFTFTPEFTGTSTTDTGSGLVTVAPSDIAFIPVSSGAQAGFMLKPLFSGSPVIQPSFYVTFRYSTQALGSYEITGETVSVAGNIPQTVPGAIAAVDQECYADGFCTVTNPTITFDTSTGLFSDPSVSATLDVPTLGIPIPGTSIISSTGSESDLPLFDSASFMFTVAPQAPLPPPAHFTFTIIDLPGIPNTAAISLNNNGKVVGQYTDINGNARAYVSDGRRFKTIDPSGATYAVAEAINDRDDIVGTYIDGANLGHGFLLRAGKFTVIDFPGGDTNAAGINNQGQVVGDYQLPDGSLHGFLWTNGVFTTIDAPLSQYPGQNTGLFSINDQDEITGIALDQVPVDRSFVLSHGFFRPLDVPGAIFTQVQALNNTDDAVGGYEDVKRIVHGFIREHNVFKTLDPPNPNVVFTLITGINSSKQVVGVFSDADGNSHSFMAQKARDNDRDDDR